MKYCLSIVCISFLVLAAGVFPVGLESVYAQPVETGLVTCEGANCDFCDAIEMVEGIIVWLFGILTGVAVLLMMVAGVKLVTSQGNPSAMSEAKGTLVNVIIGFLIMLGAWLLVDTILELLTDRGGIDEWGLVECGGMVDPTEGSVFQLEGPEGVLQGRPVGNPEVVRQVLQAAGIAVNKEECPEGKSYKEVSGGCTSVAGMNRQTIDRMIEMRSDCGASCTFTLTGGSELGHAGETNPGTHGGGDKFDLRTDATTNAYINGSSFTNDRVGNRDGRLNNEIGVFCVREDQGTDNDHWDCKRTK